MFKKLAVVAAFAVFAPMTAQAQTQSNLPCNVADLTNVVVSGCTGWFKGNLLNTDAPGPTDLDETTALNQLLNPDQLSYSVLEKIGSLGGAGSANFATAISGITVIGLHFGNGANIFKSMNDPEYNGNGGTAFYRFYANSDVAVQFSALMQNGSSGATLYSTGGSCNGTTDVGICGTVVPEPSTYALMASGLLGIFGFARRRRNNA